MKRVTLDPVGPLGLESGEDKHGANPMTLIRRILPLVVLAVLLASLLFAAGCKPG